MADFCKQCSIELFGEDSGDLAGLSRPEDTANGMYASAICESCRHEGVCQVNHEGTCMRRPAHVISTED
jgi:hypothetical protein